MRNIYAFLSAERPQYSDEVNAGRHETLAQQLMARGFAVCEVKGCYEGVPERSWMIDLRGEAPPLLYVMELAKRYGQESVLVIDAEGQGWLNYVGFAAREHLGEFRQAALPAEKLSAYTIMPDGTLWVCGASL